MRTTAIILLWVGVLSWQSGWTAATVEAAPRPGNALIYVYWPGQRWAEKSGQSPELRLSGVPVGLLRYKSYIELEVAAGTWELRLTGNSPAAKWDGPDQAFTTPLRAGEVKYVRLLVKYDQSTNTLGHGALGYVVSFLPRAPEQARAEMRKLKKVEVATEDQISSEP